VQRPDLIVFDLDGTLVDSAPDLAFAVDAMRSRLGLPPHGPEKVRSWIGNGVSTLVKRALTGEMHPEEEPERFAEGLALFSEIYAAHLCERGGLFPGVLEGLRKLKQHGFLLAVVTNKHSRFTLPLLEVTAGVSSLGSAIWLRPGETVKASSRLQAARYRKGKRGGAMLIYDTTNEYETVDGRALLTEHQSIIQRLVS